MSLSSAFGEKSGFRRKLQEAAVGILSDKIAGLEALNPRPVRLQFGERLTDGHLKEKADWCRLKAARADLKQVESGGMAGLAVAVMEVLQKPGKWPELTR